MALRATLPRLAVDSVRWVRLEFEALIPALLAGRVDLIAAGMFATPEREEQVAFSRATLCPRAALVTRRAEPDVPSTLQAFSSDPGAGVIAVLDGSVEQSATALLGVPDERVVVVPDVATGLAAVQAEEADALAITAPTAQAAVASQPDLVWQAYSPSPSIEGLVVGCSALAVRQTDPDLLRALDDALSLYVGSQAHRDVLAELGLSADDLPATARSGS